MQKQDEDDVKKRRESIEDRAQPQVDDTELNEAKIIIQV